MPPDPSPSQTAPPESWVPARRLVQAVTRPLERFLHVEAASGIVLLIAAIVALVWANSPWHHGYEHLWETPIAVSFGSWRMEESLHFWINDGLMTVFFLVVGLEIKREIVHGALSDVRRAALPIAAAVGGMIAPALIYLSLNPTGTVQRGWGVPMATDIAFAVGALTLLGNRVPAALRVLLLAVAIIDDIGAILVIALFYSSSFELSGLGVAAIGALLILGLQRIGIRYAASYIFPSLVMWFGMIAAGVHPTIAGVVVGLMAPARSWFSHERVIRVAREALDEFQRESKTPIPDQHRLLRPLDMLSMARREALAPALRVETMLHPWVAFGIMPLFALANAGVHLGGISMGDPSSFSVALGVGLGLLVGKPLGVFLLSWLAVRLRLCVLPPGVTWSGVTVLGIVAGIGFTMAIFIAELAFPGSTLLGAAKLAILIATGVAATVGLLLGRLVLPRVRADVAEITASDAEASTSIWTTGRPSGEYRSPEASEG